MPSPIELGLTLQEALALLKGASQMEDDFEEMHGKEENRHFVKAMTKLKDKICFFQQNGRRK